MAQPNGDAEFFMTSPQQRQQQSEPLLDESGGSQGMPRVYSTGQVFPGMVRAVVRVFLGCFFKRLAFAESGPFDGGSGPASL